MTDEGEQLLAAVLRSPDDDGPRLAYADWLQEQDYASSRLRGEFIALQIELNTEQPEYVLDLKSNPKVYDGSADPRIRRSIELIRNAFWTEKDAKLDALYCSRFSTWRRGFIETCRCAPDRWLTTGHELLAFHPIKTVEFDYRPQLTTKRSLGPDRSVFLEWGSLQTAVSAQKWGLWLSPDALLRKCLSDWWPEIEQSQWRFPSRH